MVCSIFHPPTHSLFTLVSGTNACSKADIEKRGENFGTAYSRLIPVSLFVSFFDAIPELGHGVDHGSHDTAADDDELVRVTDVDRL